MKCYRVLYTPDNTGFMIWADSEETALNKARKRNVKELGLNDAEDCLENYIIDEFTPETNDIGILVFYDIYSTFKRDNDY